MAPTLLEQTLIFLLAAVITVSIVRRAGFGSVLGYLIAGLLIGPSGFGFIGDVDDTLHFSELGVVFLLFVIGLELKPARLWVLRRPIFLLGGLQVAAATAALTGVGLLLGVAGKPAFIVALILSLSSTAFVLQMLAERKELTTSYGRSAFTILLFQDIAAIPMLALIPLTAANTAGLSPEAMLRGAIAIAAVIGFVVAGRLLLRPVLRFAAQSGATEIFTATTLLVAIGAAVFMDVIGLSMGLGTFLAGVLLADSEYRHALEADIEPFKGLLLGLFFIAVGMSVDLGLVLDQATIVLGLTAALLLAKGIAVWMAARVYGSSNRDAIALALILPQGGEFAFVLLAVSVGAGLITAQDQNILIVVVTLSMAATPFLVKLNERFNCEQSDDRPFDEMPDEANPVIIAGFGRVGQIVGRILRSREIPFTALEHSSAQVDFVRQFGNRVFYGDAERVDLLRAAGAGNAKLIVVTVENPEQALRIVQTVQKHFPQLPIMARARNRQHALALMDAGVEAPVRETLHSSTVLSKDVLIQLGVNASEADQIVQKFLDYDERLLIEQQALWHDEAKLIQSARDAADELASLLKSDEQQQN